MNFRVGQKVVCVSDDWEEEYPGTLVRKGDILTISRMLLCDEGKTVLLEFVEAFSPETDEWSAGYDAAAFRPLVERKTDTGMAILKSILEDAENYKVIETV